SVLQKLVSTLRKQEQQKEYTHLTPPSPTKTAAYKKETQKTIPVSPPVTQPQPQPQPQQKPQQQTKPKTPPKPTKPLSENPLFKYIKDFFTTGNIVVKVGIVILIFGVSFLLKYAADKNYFPMEARLIGVAILGLGLVGLGWYLRKKRELYALMIQGTGIAIIYLTTFTAFRVYHLVPAVPAFIILLATVVGSAFLAVKQDAKSLAVIGLSGGFLAPILVSTGSGNYIALFSFYAILNIGVVVIAWFKSWRFLNMLSFTFTFGIGAIWGLEYYKPEFFATTEPFLILFFLMYISIVLLFAIRQTTNLKGLVDASLVFGAPLVCFSFQSGLVKDTEYGLAISSFILGLFYLGAAFVLHKSQKKYFQQLFECFMAIGVVFIALTIPLAFNAQWTSALWALKGLGLVWIGIRQQRLLARYFGSFLIFIAGFTLFKFLDSGYGTSYASLAFFNGSYLGCLVKALTAIAAAYLLHKHRAKLNNYDTTLVNVFIVFGLFWWFFGIGTEIKEFFSIYWADKIGLVFVVVSCFTGDFLVKKYAQQKALLFLNTCFVFAAITPLFFMSAYYISMAWVIMGASAVIRNIKLPHKTTTYIGYILVIASFFAVYKQLLDHALFQFTNRIVEPYPILNIVFLSALLRSVLCFVTGWFTYDRSKKEANTNTLALCFLIIAVGQWLLMGVFELYFQGPKDYWLSLTLIFGALTVVGLELLKKPIKWNQLSVPGYLALPAFWFCLLIWVITISHPFKNLGWLAWPLVMAQQYWFLYRHDVNDLTTKPKLKVYHLTLFWLFTILISWEGSYLFKHHLAATLPWIRVVYCLIPVSIMLFITSQYKRIFWPLDQHAATYISPALIPIVLYGLIWTVVINITHPGNVTPLIYIPILNPIDLSMIFVFGSIIYWLYVNSRDRLATVANKLATTNRKKTIVILTVLIFYWTTQMLIRTLHQYLSIPFNFDSMYNSLVVQMSLSIYWCVIATGLMIYATKKKWRTPWITGAIILGIIVLKLVFIDYWHRAALEQIVSTIIVGLLFLVIGYFSPIPPRLTKPL
ncbi:DUF2339 domain-containing protein, partial [bacterium]|nr:DUF2339 domain-containing protein [bacterium]